MARPYEFPDPKDRSVNNPQVLVESSAMLGLYNQANPVQYGYVAQAVRSWFETEVRKAGWTFVSFVEPSAVLGVEVHLGSQGRPVALPPTIQPEPAKNPGD